MKRIIILLCCTIFLTEAAASTAPVLLLAPDARSSALGNSGAAQLADSRMIFFNPASAAGIYRTELYASADIRGDELLHTSFGAAFVLLSDKLWLHTSTVLLIPTTGDRVAALRDDISYGPDQHTQFQSGIGVSWAPSTWLATGLKFKYLHDDRTDNNGSDGFLFDLGAVFHHKGLPFRTGLALQNIYLHKHEKYIEDPFPFVWRFASVWTAIKSFQHTLEMSGAVIKAEGHVTELGFGVEFLIREKFIIRSGWHTHDKLPRLGIGFQDISVAATLKVDISYQYTDYSQSIFKISVNAGF